MSRARAGSSESELEAQRDTPSQRTAAALETYRACLLEEATTVVLEESTTFVCPISFDTMTDPVVASDGLTYDRFQLFRAIDANVRMPGCLQGELKILGALDDSCLLSGYQLVLLVFRLLWSCKMFCNHLRFTSFAIQWNHHTQRIEAMIPE